MQRKATPCGGVIVVFDSKLVGLGLGAECCIQAAVSRLRLPLKSRWRSRLNCILDSYFPSHGD